MKNYTEMSLGVSLGLDIEQMKIDARAVNPDLNDVALRDRVAGEVATCRALAESIIDNYRFDIFRLYLSDGENGGFQLVIAENPNPHNEYLSLVYTDEMHFEELKAGYLTEIRTLKECLLELVQSAQLRSYVGIFTRTVERFDGIMASLSKIEHVFDTLIANVHLSRFSE